MSDVLWRTGDGAIEGLWPRLAACGWLPSARERVVLHVDGGAASALVRATARALAAFLAARPGAPPLAILDPENGAAAWPGVATVDLASEPRYRVATARLPDGVAIPALWLDDFFLVTIAAAAPDARLALRAVLGAQAALLDAPGALDLDAIVAAHRLMRSSLCVGCGTLTFADPSSGSWWAASRDDVALERAIAAAAGTDPTALPALRHLARHEAEEPAAPAVDGAPALHRYVAPGWRVRVGRCGTALAHAAGRVRRDVGLGVRNLERLPSFVARRAPARLRKRSAA